MIVLHDWYNLWLLLDTKTLIGQFRSLLSGVPIFYFYCEYANYDRTWK